MLLLLSLLPLWKTKKGKTSKFVDALGDNRNERKGNWRLRMGRLREMQKKNNFPLATERCENIKNLYIK